MTHSKRTETLQGMSEILAASAAAAGNDGGQPQAPTGQSQPDANGTGLRQHELPRLAARLHHVLQDSPSLTAEAAPLGWETPGRE